MSLFTVLALTALLAAAARAGPASRPPTPPARCCSRTTCPLEGRKSPLDSLTFTVAKQPVKLCYGRPSSRGRTMIGGAAVPYGKLWRTGANEPTIFFTPVALDASPGSRVPPGTYSLYTVPGATEWEIIVNRSTTQWGEESNYTPEVQAQEVGRAKVKSETAEGAGRDVHHPERRRGQPAPRSCSSGRRRG